MSSLDTIISRISIVEEIQDFLKENGINEDTCNLDKNTLIQITDKIGEGGLNQIFKLKIQDYEKEFIIHIPKQKSTTNIYQSCINDQYALIFSEIVKKNIFPNFPLVLNSFLCDNDYSNNQPISIQEFSNRGDLTKSLPSPHKNISKQNILQTLLSLKFMHTSLKLSHNDMKPENVLLMKIKPTTICYKLSEECYISLETPYITLLTDFDFVANNKTTFHKYQYIFEYYIKHKVVLLYLKYDNKTHNIGLSDEFKLLISDLPLKMREREYTEVDMEEEKEFDTEQIKNIKRVFNKVIKSESSFIKDISQFLLMCLNYNEFDFIYPFLMEITEDNFNECIIKYFNDSMNVNDSYTLGGYFYNINLNININKVIKDVYNDHKTLFACAQNDIAYRLYSQDEYITELFKLNQFKIKRTTTDEQIQEYINKDDNEIRIYMINIILQMYSMLKAKINTTNKELLSSLMLIDYLLKRMTLNIEDKKRIKQISFVCYFMFIPISVNVGTKSFGTKEELYKIMDEIFYILSQD